MSVSLTYTLFFVRNSFVRNLNWDGQISNTLSVLKPQRSRNLYFFSFSYHNFEDTVTNFDKKMFGKSLSVVKTPIIN